MVLSKTHILQILRDSFTFNFTHNVRDRHLYSCSRPVPTSLSEVTQIAVQTDKPRPLGYFRPSDRLNSSDHVRMNLTSINFELFNN